MMKQFELSTRLKSEVGKVLAAFPKTEFWVEKSIQIEFESPNKNVILWIDSQSNEISIGLADEKIKKTTWHAHLFQLGAKSLEEQVVLGVQFIAEILENTRPLFQNSESWQIDEEQIKKDEPRINWENI